MIVYCVIFLIAFSPIAIELGVFSNALPTIIINIVSFCILTWHYRFELRELYNEEKIFRYFSLITTILIAWGFSKSENPVQYAICIRNLPIITFPVWVVLMRDENHSRYLCFLFWCVFILGFVKFTGEPSQSMGNYGGYTSIIYLFIFFLPYVSKIWKLTLILFWFLSLTYDLTDRTHIIMMVFCVALVILTSIIYRFNLYINTKTIQNIGLGVPIVAILFLSIGTFSIFSLSESKELANIQGIDQNDIDTRTIIYQEVWEDTHTICDFVLGKSYVGTYRSSLADIFGVVELNRTDCEVGILELFIRGGIIYVFIFFTLIYHTSRVALEESNNSLIFSLGLFTLLYWNVFFVELQMNTSMWNYALWIGFGFILNPEIQELSEDEIYEKYKDIINPWKLLNPS